MSQVNKEDISFKLRLKMHLLNIWQEYFSIHRNFLGAGKIEIVNLEGSPTTEVQLRIGNSVYFFVGHAKDMKIEVDGEGVKCARTPLKYDGWRRRIAKKNFNTVAKHG